MALTVYADGSGTYKRDEPGGVGFVAYRDDGSEHSRGSLSLPRATNQVAEILAAAYALHELPVGEPIVVISDSEYVVKGYTEWMPKWRDYGWKKKPGGKPPANLRCWLRLVQAVDRHVEVSFRWTRGHAGTEGNEIADKLAGAARREAIEALTVRG